MVAADVSLAGPPFGALKLLVDADAGVPPEPKLLIGV